MYSEVEWLKSITSHITEGQFFLAQDTAIEALEQYPKSLAIKKLHGLSLLKTGALEEARVLIEPLSTNALLDKEHLKKTLLHLKNVSKDIDGVDLNNPSWSSLSKMAELAMSLDEAGQMAKNAIASDDESLELLASIYKALWKQSQNAEQLKQTEAIYRNAYRQTPSLNFGVNTALLDWVMGNKAEASKIAANCLNQFANPATTDEYFLNGIAKLISGHNNAAISSFQQGKKLSGVDRGPTLHYRDEILLLEEAGMKIPDEIVQLLAPPTIVAFTGHMIDTEGRTKPRFPAYLEPYVKEEIHKHFEAINAEIGYSAAAAGGDILFLESMLDRNGEINIVLPFDTEDFVNASVRYSDPVWITRFRHLMKLANNISYATTENYLGDDILFQFGGLLCFGEALLRAQTMKTDPHLLVVWDREDSTFVGGTSDQVSRWHDPERLHVVDVKELMAKHPEPKAIHLPNFTQQLDIEVKSPTPLYKKERVVKSMLFADVKGFSKLEEHHIPGFITFLEKIAEHLNLCDSKPIFVNTWGDAIFAVLDDAISMAKYSLALKEALFRAADMDFGLPTKMTLRIGLHAGPTYCDTDPITGRINFYGSHVNRAARIEPVTVPGRVYASEQFVALLAAEESHLMVEAEKNKETYQSPWVYEYIGNLALAKKFGEQKIYHLRECR
jgi:pilus assembly protein FimV